MTRNDLLRQARIQRHWTQSTLAAQLNTTRMTVVRWEQGQTSPSLYFREQLCQVFSLTEQELGLGQPPQVDQRKGEGLTQPLTFTDEEDSTLESLNRSGNGASGRHSSEVEQAQVWLVPEERNPFFTGRETILQSLSTLFWEEIPAYPVQILSGLAGMGKTQIALEYAYRFEQHYATILWLRAETRETFVADLHKLAQALHLPEGYAQDEAQLEHALRCWLETSSNWLLIFDNLEDFTLVPRLLPLRNLKGHVLITTRTQATGRFGRNLNLREMNPDEGALLLLRRAKLLPFQQNLTHVPTDVSLLVTELCIKLGGFPLALNQAGSYIEETGCSLEGYLERLQHRRSALLSWRGQNADGYPASVTATLLLAQERVARQSPVALELLHLCLFLHPGAIPEKLIIGGAFRLGALIQSAVADLLTLDEAFAVLNASALIRRNPETHMLAMHPLVQTVLRDSIEVEEQDQWLERIVYVLHDLFPASPRYEVIIWPFCELLLPHILHCIELVEHMAQGEQRMQSVINCSDFLLRVADYQLERGRYQEAETLFKRALDFAAYDSSVTSPSGQVATLRTLALLYERLGRYKEAEILVQEMLLIQRQSLAENDLQIASSLQLLILLHGRLGQYIQAEQFAQQALLIYEQREDEKSFEFADFLQTMAQLNIWLARYHVAASWATRSLTLLEKILGPEDPALARGMHTLAVTFWEQGEYEKAGELFLHISLIWEQTLGLEHPFIGYSLHNRALLYKIEGEYDQAEKLFLHVLELWENMLGPSHLEKVEPLKNLSEIYLLQQRYTDAERIIARALELYEESPGMEHPQVAVLLSIRAAIATEQGFYAQAENLYRQAFLLCQRSLDQHHPHLAYTLHGFARLYMQREMYEEARPLLQQALDIRIRKLGVLHPDTRLSQKFYDAVLAALQDEKQETLQHALLADPNTDQAEKHSATASDDDAA